MTQQEVGASTLGAVKLWIDKVSGRLNTEERGKYLGKFDTGDFLVSIYSDGTYRVSDLDQNRKFDASKLIDMTKWSEETVVSAVYFEGEKDWTMIKRFEIETSSLDQSYKFITDSRTSKLYYASLDASPIVKFSYRENKEKHTELLFLEDFIDVKGWKAIGNKLGEFKILKIEDASKVDLEKAGIEIEKSEEETETPEPKPSPKKAVQAKKPAPKAKRTAKKAATKKKTTRKTKGSNGKLNPGDTIEFDF